MGRETGDKVLSGLKQFFQKVPQKIGDFIARVAFLVILVLGPNGAGWFMLFLAIMLFLTCVRLMIWVLQG